MKLDTSPRLKNQLLFVATALFCCFPLALHAAWKNYEEADLILGRQAHPSATSLVTFHGEPGLTSNLVSSTDMVNWVPEKSYSFTDSLPVTFVNLKTGPKRFFRFEEP